MYFIGELINKYGSKYDVVKKLVKLNLFAAAIFSSSLPLNFEM